ncbi:probable splicing factor, arginine/serine-rich 4 [Camellia sinensis]|uniref:probable splicing factor, arginine/serine-rich 4 n=1 Tax=Camellia sinensis TaxID=4442 RepID=UPI001035C76E|nr:probable splicing factor, arginine/serine-rich 4 [Camellia sinensis]
MNDGGWKPVLKKRRMGLQTGRSRMNDLVSLFVDEVPEAMTPSDLFNLFSKFGVVKDVFIPLKIRKTTRSRFGFVRYDCKVAAEVVVRKTDGLWCHNRALRVKMAEHSKCNQSRQMLTNAKQGGMV